VVQVTMHDGPTQLLAMLQELVDDGKLPMSAVKHPAVNSPSDASAREQQWQDLVKNSWVSKEGVEVMQSDAVGGAWSRHIYQQNGRCYKSAVQGCLMSVAQFGCCCVHDSGRRAPLLAPSSTQAAPAGMA